MARRSLRNDPEKIRLELLELLKNFEKKLGSSDLRKKVIALIPAYHLLRDLGSSLIPDDGAEAARDRILHYLRKYPLVVISGEELMVVAGISEWARRVRELRVQFGWRIASGVTLREMCAEETVEINGTDIKSLKPHDYLLLSTKQDRELAFRWNVANGIRREKDLSVQAKVLKFLKANVGKEVTNEELKYVANNKTEWARRVRELRTEHGWSVVTRNTGRPDLSVGVYILESDRQLPTHDRKISDGVRFDVLTRDEHSCRECGWNHAKWNPSDPRQQLELHHIQHHADKGGNSKDNLITLCNVCHDLKHKKAGS